MTTNKFLPFMMANVQAKNYENGKVFVYSSNRNDRLNIAVNLPYKECLNQLHL